MTTYLTPSDAVLGCLDKIAADGTESSPRGQTTFELLNEQFTITEPWYLPVDIRGRELNQAIGALEALQLVGQIMAPEVITDRVRVFSNFTDGGVFHGGYGQRIAGRLDDLGKLLDRDPDSRQAVLSIFDSATDLNRDKRDIPCTIALQFFVRDSRLHMRTCMRSNDVWLGLPYDLTQFITLQSAVASHLAVPMGTYTHSVGSMHLYEQHIELARDVSVAYTSDASVACKRLYDARPIGETSSRARRILMGEMPDMMDLHETWLANSIAKGA